MELSEFIATSIIFLISIAIVTVIAKDFIKDIKKELRHKDEAPKEQDKYNR